MNLALTPQTPSQTSLFETEDKDALLKGQASFSVEVSAGSIEA